MRSFLVGQVVCRLGFQPNNNFWVQFCAIGCKNSAKKRVKKCKKSHFWSSLEFKSSIMFRPLQFSGVGQLFFLFSQNCRTHFPRFWGKFFKTVENGLAEIIKLSEIIKQRLNAGIVQIFRSGIFGKYVQTKSVKVQFDCKRTLSLR